MTARFPAISSEPAARFLAVLDQSGLLARDRTDSVADLLAGQGTAEGVAGVLVRERYLTPFQARQLLRGRHAGFFPADKYKVLDVLGEGGMGRVLLCEHLLLQKLVAVKQLHPTECGVPGSVERFLREARAVAKLDHPNIVRVMDVDSTGKGPLIVMDYVDGTNLHALVADRGKLPVRRVAEYVRQAALALGCAHGAGLIHRDVKPGNLMLDRTGTVKVIDFGLSRITAVADPTEDDAWDDSFLLGTADFVSPEQASEHDTVDPRSDIYSLGCTAYFLLTGRFPFDGGSVKDKLARHKAESAPLASRACPEVPEAFAAAVAKMMMKAPDQRFQSADEVVAAMAPFCTEPVARPAPAEMPTARPDEFRLGTCRRPAVRFEPKPLASRTTPAPMAKLRLDSKVYQKLDLPKTKPLPGRPAPADRATPADPVPTTRLVTGPRTAAVLYALCGAALFLSGGLAGLLLR